MTTTGAAFKDHLVICGWEGSIAKLIGDVLAANPHWTAGDVVLVAAISEDQARELADQPDMAGMTLVREEPFHETALEKASIRTAAKVLVLADESHADASPTEIDAQTIMTMMTVERMAPHVYKIAEMIDPGFSSYLKVAEVDEIIYPREYSRFLLAGITTSAGLAHTVYDLLTVDAACVLTTAPVPDEYVGKTFGDLFRYFDGQTGDRHICIGLLENTGNIHILRRRAKIDAQKAGGYGAVIQNLRRVREVASNRPHLNPGDDYIIKPYTMAVTVMTQAETPASAGSA